MYMDRNQIQEYPFDGKFTDFVEGEDENGMPTEETIIILETKCDIQESAKSDAGGFISASFSIYFPFEKLLGMPVKRGMTFEGSIYGMSVDGEVVGVFPTQMGGCTAYIKDRTT